MSLDIDCRRHTGNRHIHRQDGIPADPERDLYRAADLAGIGSGGHDGTKRPHIIEQFASFSSTCIDALFVFGPLHASFLLGVGNVAVDVGSLLDDHFHARLALVGHLDVIADAPLGGHVGDEAMQGLRVDARGVPHVRVPVGVGVGAGQVVDKLVAILNGHVSFPPSSELSFALLPQFSLSVLW